MKNKYYTVAETAKKLNITRQAVYKKLATQFKNSCIKQDEKTLINADIIDKMTISTNDNNVEEILQTTLQKQLTEGYGHPYRRDSSAYT